jgi:hypothetical protein
VLKTGMKLISNFWFSRFDRWANFVPVRIHHFPDPSNNKRCYSHLRCFDKASSYYQVIVLHEPRRYEVIRSSRPIARKLVCPRRDTMM